jgi:amino acid adenylation domain-containing protein
LQQWNATQASYPQNKCIHELFEEQADRTPQAIAVICEEREVSYGELNAHANRLAHHLRRKGVQPDDRVAICVERSVEMVVGLLAILKAGGGYVPLDPNYPPERLGYMLTDSEPVAVFCDTAGQEALAAHAVDIQRIDLTGQARWADEPETNPDRAAIDLQAQHLAYVIYTSGSTGMPKGVMITHDSLNNLLTAMRGLMGLDPSDRLLSVTTLAFDIAALELFAPLLSGASVVVAGRHITVDPGRLMQSLSTQGITVLQATPASWRALLENGWQADSNLRALCGGEALAAGLATQLCDRTQRCWNVYGPTETTVWSSALKL